MKVDTFANFFDRFENTNNYSEYSNNYSDNCTKVWTLEKLKDELFIHLISIKIHGERKYEKQARDLIYRIPVYQPVPYFIIHQNDLTQRLKKELLSLNDVELDAIIREVISWIYESINKKYFLLSIKRYGLISWRIDP